MKPTVVEQRQGIANALTQKLSKLGLQRRVKGYDLTEYVADRYS